MGRKKSVSMKDALEKRQRESQKEEKHFQAYYRKPGNKRI